MRKILGGLILLAIFAVLAIVCYIDCGSWLIVAGSFGAAGIIIGATWLAAWLIFGD